MPPSLAGALPCPTPSPTSSPSSEEVDPDTLANLGPLRGLAGVWEGAKGLDVNPKAEGPERAQFIERIELQPIDPQANGPQLFYGLRYHAHILKPGEATTYHDQVGYWLWEPATASSRRRWRYRAARSRWPRVSRRQTRQRAKVAAWRGETENGICSTVFLERAFKTESYEIEVTCHPDGTWSYFEDTVLLVCRARLNHSTTRTATP